MNETKPVEFTEDRVPMDGLEGTIEELVELYGGAMQQPQDQLAQRQFILPLRRGVATAGGVHCTLSWASEGDGDALLRLVCDRDIDAPRGQRIAMLGAGVVGSLMFTVWPFFPKAASQLGALAWLGGIVALAVYFLSLRKTSGGVAFDFLRRLAGRQREMHQES